MTKRLILLGGVRDKCWGNTWKNQDRIYDSKGVSPAVVTGVGTSPWILVRNDKNKTSNKKRIH